MKYTDRELDRLLEKLIASTRSPRGKFSAAASYQILEKRLPRPALRLFSLRTLSAVAAIALLCFITRVRDKDCVKNRVKRAKIVRFTLC